MAGFRGVANRYPSAALSHGHCIELPLFYSGVPVGRAVGLKHPFVTAGVRNGERSIIV